MSDRDLRQAVEEALDWEPIVNAKRIGVSVKDGVVTLTGHADSFPQKREAEKVAGLVAGVKAVACELEVALAPPDQPADEEIAGAASNAIARNTLLPNGTIQVWVDHGRVTLEGVVDSQQQRASARQCIRCLAGVKDVNNHIVVKPGVNRIAVKTRIEAALLRNAQLDANSIHVEVLSDRVILRGTVQSWIEREEAERAAWGAAGVSDVDNALNVNPVSHLVSY
jgi:osmotically-inducible protein OsmY